MAGLPSSAEGPAVSSRKSAKRRHVARVRRRHAEKRKCRAAVRRESEDSVPDSEIWEGPVAGIPKMSETILEYAEPLLENAQTEGEVRGAIMFAVAAWNASYPPDKKWRRSLVDCKATEFDSSDLSRDFEDSMSAMVELRRVFYADEDRIVYDFELTFDHGQAHLNVVSIPTERPASWLVTSSAQNPRSDQPELDWVES